MALQAYRHLWRAAQLAFQGDAPVLLAAQTQIRNQFRETSQSLNPTDTDGVRAAVQHAEDVAKILRENVVQGAKDEQKENSYKLRIHEHTERGDNESIKTAGSRPSQTGCGCK